MKLNNDIIQIQDQINNMINVNTKILRRKKTDEDIKRELFIDIINKLELVVNRSSLTKIEIGIDLSLYDDAFYNVIDSLILMLFGSEAANLISAYCYDRDPMENYIIYEDDKGNEIEIKNIDDLWNEIKKIL